MKTITMKFNHVPALVALCLLLTPTFARAATYTWVASSGMYPDDADPSMVLVDTASSEDPVLGTNDLLLATDQAAETMYYIQQGANIAMPATNFFIEASVVFVSGTAQYVGDSPLTILFTTAPNVGGALCIRSGVVWLHSGIHSVRGPAVNVATDDTFHVYRIEADNPRVAGSPVRVYRDGSVILISALLGTSWLGSTPLIWFGDGGTSQNGVSRWKSFKHNAAVRDSSVLRLSIYTAVEFCWLTESNKVYQPQWAPRVGTNNWSNLGDPVLGDGTFKCIMDSTRRSPQKVYRVMAQ